ncbi:MAG TPA: hypothetical protein VFT03_08495 [Rubrobacteraceae bacterium]|nr:hypothetical protein [Rubrobacteraceae bacterium]
MSDLENLRREEPEEAGTAAYVSVALGIGLLVTTVFVIITAGALAAGFPFVLGAAACLGWGTSRFARQRHALPESGGERALLSALRENGGGITPAEAAMETSLTVKEADRMLSQLASEGHLLVESREGSLFYALPRRSSPQLEGR